MRDANEQAQQLRFFLDTLDRHHRGELVARGRMHFSPYTITAARYGAALPQSTEGGDLLALSLIHI